MRLLTDEQHAQVVELLQEPTYNRCKEALATLTAAPSLEVVAIHRTETGSLKEHVTLHSSKFKVPAGWNAAYAIKKETP